MTTTTITAPTTTTTTTADTTATTAEYNVTFFWAAQDWEGAEDEDGEINYDDQPTTTTECTVTLPTTATPYEVYEAADCRMDEPTDEDGAGLDGWDGDGISIETSEGYEYSYNVEDLHINMTWGDTQN